MKVKFKGIVKWNGNHYFSGDLIEGFYVEDYEGVPYIRVHEYIDGCYVRTIDLEIEKDTLEQL